MAQSFEVSVEWDVEPHGAVVHAQLTAYEQKWELHVRASREECAPVELIDRLVKEVEVLGAAPSHH